MSPAGKQELNRSPGEILASESAFKVFPLQVQLILQRDVHGVVPQSGFVVGGDSRKPLAEHQLTGWRGGCNQELNGTPDETRVSESALKVLTSRIVRFCWGKVAAWSHDNVSCGEEECPCALG